ncbi:hypothetical protein N7516_001803 [Penicillium verrucosum]|uniref:uncharacterized protein n=1 Tax=Penicillium verrucosum TaxID=60171 RepID=UPI0025459A9B|nr:uncharacterized protein N7516_001803 [Penicillium verrucosum]KAJ5941635.1 hypothetical protein N7516_001803 [Penicillium verrucosum]
MFELEAGSKFQLDASVSATQWSVHQSLASSLDEAGSVVKVTLTLPPPERCCVELISRKAIQKGQSLHDILEVKDNGSAALITSRLVVIQATNEKLLGGGCGAAIL